MPTYRTVRLLSPTERGYLAGLVDGEGTVSLSRKHANEFRHLVVSVSNTESDLLQYVRSTIGCGKITRKKTAKPNHSPSMTYAIWNRQALALLSQIEPHLRSYKKLRARFALEHYVRLTPRNGKYTAELRGQRAAFEQRLLGMRFSMARPVNYAPPCSGD
jgi:hypothetical protein